MTGVLWFVGGMLVTSLVVGGVIFATRDTATPAITAEQLRALTPIEIVRCPATTRPATLISAAACGQTDILRDLLARGADVTQTDPRAAFDGRTALHHAVQRGDEEQVQMLLAAGAAPDARDAQGNTALHLLTLGSEAEHPLYVARFLIDAGASLDIRNDHELTPLETLEVDHMRMVEQQDLAQMLLRTQQLADSESEPAAPVLKAAAQATPPVAIAPVPREDTESETQDAPPAATGAQAPADVAPVVGSAQTVSPEAAALPSEPALPVEALVAAEASGPTPAGTTQPETSVPETHATGTPAIEPPAPPPSQESLIRARLDAWAQAWANKDMDAYFDAYAPTFAPPNNLSTSTWRAQREVRIAGKEDAIEITLSDIAIEQHDDTARVDFVQHYRAGSYAEASRKHIEMTLHDGRWCIVAERETG